MQVLKQRLTWVALCSIVLATQVTQAAPSDDRFAATIAQFNKLSPAAQEKWLANLFSQRALPAYRITLSAAEVQRQADRQQAVLKTMRAGKQLSDSGLRKL